MTVRWYVVQAYANFEKKVAETIEKEAQKKGLEHFFERILVPTEKQIEVRRGRKIDVERKFFPGYIFVKVTLTDDVCRMIRNIPRVAGFLGTESHPLAVSEDEIQKILDRIQDSVDCPKSSVSFEVGEQVRVSDGPFASFNGIVQEVEEERARLKVEVSIFGRATPVDLDFGQVEKV